MKVRKLFIFFHWPLVKKINKTFKDLFCTLFMESACCLRRHLTRNRTYRPKHSLKLSCLQQHIWKLNANQGLNSRWLHTSVKYTNTQWNGPKSNLSHKRKANANANNVEFHRHKHLCRWVLLDDDITAVWNKFESVRLVVSQLMNINRSC